MNTIKLQSFAKINLSIDVLGKRKNGYHDVDMIMQQVQFSDQIKISYDQGNSSKTKIKLTTNKYYLPTDERNLAYQAAEIMINLFKSKIDAETIYIEIKKMIPVAAGLAGGSGNCAAVIHGMNQLFNLELNIKQMCEIAAKLGSDVPFCIMGQAKSTHCLKNIFKDDFLATNAARATDTGIKLKPIKGLHAYIVLVKPAISVSTKTVYEEIDNCELLHHPNNDELEKALYYGNYKKILKNMINVLEEVTLKRYDRIHDIKEILEEKTKTYKTLMSGSGPTVFALYYNLEDAQEACKVMRTLKYESYWTKTLK